MKDVWLRPLAPASREGPQNGVFSLLGKKKGSLSLPMGTGYYPRFFLSGGFSGRFSLKNRLRLDRSH